MSKQITRWLVAMAAMMIIAGCGKPTESGGETAGPGADPTVPAAPAAASSGIVIGLSMADLKEERWQRDRDMFVAKAEAMGAKVMIRDAGGDPQAQVEQCNNLLLKNVDILVVIPKDADAAAPIVRAAHQKKVKVLAYDRLITGADTDLYISFDNYEVGRIQARAVLEAVPEGKYLLLGGDTGDKNAAMLRAGQMEILQPAVDAGKIQIVADPFCDKWLRSEATRHTEDALAKHPDIAAIVASNDGTAGGAIAALKKVDRAGQVAVSGQDADQEACQNVVKGQQTVTVYKPIRAIAEASAQLAVALAEGKDVPTAMAVIDGAVTQEIDNGKINVPTLFLTPIPVTKDNMDATVIADGYHSRQAIYGAE